MDDRVLAKLSRKIAILPLWKQFVTMISSGGTFALSGSGSLASSSIIVGASTTFDGSGVTGGYTSGQTIFGTGTMSWDTSLLGSTGLLTVVPESSTVLLGGLGALLMLRRRRA